MAYEVTKLVNGRPYRYQVRSERDPATGKSRNRWTYLGRGEPGAKPGPAKPRPNARQALLDALERLLDRSDPSTVTAGAVSVEAGLAHGTFYRYFRNRVAAIHALTERLRAELALELGLLDDPPAGAASARAALRSWTRAILHARTKHHGLVRALYALAAHDEDVRNTLRARRDVNARRLATWLSVLAERGIAVLPDVESTGAVLFSMLDGIGREAVDAGEPLEEERVNVAVDLVERAVFGVL
ncbi:MAG TPA: TetR/AcrR family transcriptional regulator [Candidatus Lustribacter sp.]|jgi:AcrR family transcriptional regulator|nr:TetR/AcrR family transcriptional regulator [Candidatus Lustribacter sp.]